MSLFERILTAAITLLVGLIAFVMLAPVVMIDVEIYAAGDPEKFFYCATGSLNVPPARFVASGAVPEGDESYC